MRRLRKSEGMRRLVRETQVTMDDLVCPILISEGLGAPQYVESMPNMQRIPPGMVAGEISNIWDMDIPAVMLFGMSESRDAGGTAAYDEGGVIQKAIQEAKKTAPDMVIMADVCLCQYNDTGHCGIVRGDTVDNDATIRVLGDIATSYARAGADVVAPSAMMDGQVATIRESLDAAGFPDTAIMPHAKHGSEIYSPFREAAKSAPQFGDRRQYQVPYTNPREAIMDMESDIAEGADIIMVKPAMTYLDMVAEAKRRFDVPVAAYSASGEYAMVQAAHEMGWLDGPKATLEILASIKRAGADIIVTHFSRDAADIL